MNNGTSINLSKYLIRAYGCYTVLECIVEEVTETGEISEDDRAEMEDTLDDLAFYMNEITKNSTPDHWLPEELEWIEGVRGDLAASGASDQYE